MLGQTGKIPARLYKYRAFSANALEMLVEDDLHFADPDKFNDPLDTKPTLEPDLSEQALADLLSRLFEERTQAEMTAAAKSIRYRGPKTLEHIASVARKQALRLIEDIRYNATNPEYEFDNPEQYLLGRALESELLQRYDRGVFSLAERTLCPLMWSHYGDQHKGICVGYSVPSAAQASLHQMQYGGSRLVRASDVAAMTLNEEGAKQRVDDAVLLRKAKAWKYEKEWRLFGPRGSHSSPLELEEITFGMRCPAHVVYSVVKALQGRSRPVRFFEVYEQKQSFVLKRRTLNMDEMLVFYPRRALTIAEMVADFSDLSD